MGMIFICYSCSQISKPGLPTLLIFVDEKDYDDVKNLELDFIITLQSGERLTSSVRFLPATFEISGPTHRASNIDANNIGEFLEAVEIKDKSKYYRSSCD